MYTEFGKKETFGQKKMIKYAVAAIVGTACLCAVVSYGFSSNVAAPMTRGAVAAKVPTTMRMSTPSRTKVHGGGSFVNPGGPFDPAQIGYRVLGATMLHEVLRGYLITRYRKLSKLNPKRWGKVETLERAENEVNMGLTPTDIPDEIKGTPLETSYKDPFYAHAFPSVLDYLNAGLAGKNYKPKDKAPMISYWR